MDGWMDRADKERRRKGRMERDRKRKTTVRKTEKKVNKPARKKVLLQYRDEYYS